MENNKIIELIKATEMECKEKFAEIDEVAFINQQKVLTAFKKNKIALRHFAPTSGYGYDDIGREALARVFSDIFGTESAIVSPLIASGTHAISLCLFGLLRPNDTILSISGEPYDTMHDILVGDGIGSLKDFGVKFESVPLKDNSLDYENIIAKIKELKPKLVYLQRSRGYSWRNAFSIAEIKEIATVIKAQFDCIIMVDNCYGEFVDTLEPTNVLVDLVVGSMIKNPGGGIAPTGGYICGSTKLVELIGYRLTAPGVGLEIGSYNSSYQLFFQGVFLAPHIVAQALKGAILFSKVYENLGYETLPKIGDKMGDIITSIKFNNPDDLIAFCQTIQSCSPIDSHVTPYPWDMPGYQDKVIMAAGTFVQGASIELSADSPIRAPYIAYLQGGLTYEHVKCALMSCLEKI